MSQTDLTWIPTECTLPTGEQPLRAAEFEDLFATHLVRVDRLGPSRARLLLAGDAGLQARVQGLADRETSCCSFYDFTVTTTTDPEEAVELDIRVPDRQDRVLAALTGLAERAQAGTTHD
jgi:hypothetical protein